MKDKVCAVVITYNTDNSYLENFKSLKNSVDKVIIVDNSYCTKTIKMLKDLEKKYHEKVILILNNQNIGLSKAQNKGIKIGLNLGYDWILILDDDSTLEQNMLKNMFEEYNKLNEKMKSEIGILAPRIVEKNIKEEKSILILKEREKYKKIEIQIDKNYLSTYVVIASGSLIKKDIFEKIGFMEEDFFIDSIDTEFCLRLISNDYKIFLIGKAFLFHTLGNKNKIKFLFKEVVVLNHSPFRKYHIFRNRIKTWKKYYNKEKSYVFFEIKATIQEFINTLLFEKEKKKKLKMMILGIKDGLKS